MNLRKAQQQRNQLKHVINECNYQSEHHNKPFQIEIKKKFKDYDNYLQRFDNHVGVLVKIPSCHIDEPFTEDIEARCAYRAQMDLKATQFKLDVSKRCRRYRKSIQEINRRHSVDQSRYSGNTLKVSDSQNTKQSVKFFRVRDFQNLESIQKKRE